MPGDELLDTERLVAIASTVLALVLGAIALLYRVRGDEDESETRARTLVIDEADRIIQWNRGQAQDAVEAADRAVESSALLRRELDDCRAQLRAI